MIGRRFAQLIAGLVVYGFATALMVRSGLGLNPWDVLHQGLDKRTNLSSGTVVILTGIIVLILWVPLRQRPGIGTISNVLVIGLAADLALRMIPVAVALPVRASMLFVGILLLGIATSAYIGAGLGPGPRNGLMTGVADRTGWPVGVVRTAIEVSVLATGWWLGGAVGAGTVLYAVAIGPLIQATLPIFEVRTTATYEECRRQGR
jgi:uncharacterized membrane protein YczE